MLDPGGKKSVSASEDSGVIIEGATALVVPGDGVLVVMPSTHEDVFPERYREALKAQFEAVGFRTVVVLARPVVFTQLGEPVRNK